MATKILLSGNRIMFDGHADTAEECRAITAMCDALNANENFNTIKYESGYAEFEQVSGGESEMFAMQDYVLTSRYDSETGYSAAELAAKGTIKARLDDLEEYQEDCENEIFLEIAAMIIEAKGCAFDAAEKTARVKGVWVFDLVPTSSKCISQSLNFTIPTSEEYTGRTSFDRISVGKLCCYSFAQTSVLMYGDSCAIDDEPTIIKYGWPSDNLRTIDFGSEPQACSEDFANWLTSTATAGEGAEVEILKSSQERLEELEAILPATAEVGQYLKVSAVDENGKITAVEPVSAPAEYKLSLTASEVAERLGQL